METSMEINITFFEQLALIIIGIIGSIIVVCIGWYLRKRETCNRIKEKTVEDMASDLKTHLELAKKEVQRIDGLGDRIDNLKDKNKLIE